MYNSQSFCSPEWVFSGNWTKLTGRPVTGSDRSATHAPVTGRREENGQRWLIGSGLYPSNGLSTGSSALYLCKCGGVWRTPVVTSKYPSN
ncbi:hypothetical protein J6590_027175 [Homalodisca vitripennis]|nr:hypothetical protein J6590_027175 [Homalodisca vitripennis]